MRIVYYATVCLLKYKSFRSFCNETYCWRIHFSFIDASIGPSLFIGLKNGVINWPFPRSIPDHKHGLATFQIATGVEVKLLFIAFGWGGHLPGHLHFSPALWGIIHYRSWSCCPLCTPLLSTVGNLTYFFHSFDPNFWNRPKHSFLKSVAWIRFKPNFDMVKSSDFCHYLTKELIGSIKWFNQFLYYFRSRLTTL